MVGTFELQPPGRKFPRLGRVTIRFGRPLDFSASPGWPTRVVVRSVTDEIMYEILALSGQEYVDRYAGEVKAEQQQANRITARLRRKQSP